MGEVNDCVLWEDDIPVTNTEQVSSVNTNYFQPGGDFLDSFLSSQGLAAPLAAVENSLDSEDVPMAESNEDDDNEDVSTAESNEEDDSVKKKNVCRNYRGPFQQPLETLPAKNRDNVLRCREYRMNKKVKYVEQSSELETLQARNKRLKEKEQKMKDSLVKMQARYLKFISEGKIKFA